MLPFLFLFRRRISGPHRSCTGGGQVWQPTFPAPTGPAPVEARFGNHAGPRRRISGPHRRRVAVGSKGRRIRMEDEVIPNRAPTGAGPVGSDSNSFADP